MHRRARRAHGLARAVLPTALLALAGCSEGPISPGAGSPPETLADWKAQREELDQTVWSDERLAGAHEQTLVALWDRLIDAGRRGDFAEKVSVLAALDFETLRVGAPRASGALDHGIESFVLDAAPRTLAPVDWGEQLDALAGAGHRLIQAEFHHARFTPPRGGAPARSRIAVAFHVVDDARERRLVVEGELGVVWSQRRDAHGNPVPSRIDATGLRMLTRDGAPAFQRILRHEWPQGGGRARLHPVLLHDLDGDGLPEIVLLGANGVLWNHGGGSFDPRALLPTSPRFAEAGAVADLTGDGHADLLAARASGDLALYRGDGRGRFAAEPRVGPDLGEPLRAPSAITLGDVDADGDLDAWVAQYKPAYLEGQMPSPFYDANDGYPSHLLRNDGDGRFTPVTEEAGLAEKRFRRTYASSFVDLDDDGDLDLLVVGDYAGVDLHHNDGTGRFVDANHTLRADRHLFGMSVSFADFDLDGRLDFYVAGMASTTARRLEALGLARKDRPDIREMRMRMAFGNRMYVARDGRWHEPAFARQVARTGWTWGTTAFDFDNDGDRDVFAANGHESGESTRDYCSNFWTHDIYDGSSEPNPGLLDLFSEAGRGVTSGAESWDGYQKNHLLMNLAGRGFANVAFLLGVADEFDSRSAVSGDLDLDGRVDLVVVEDHGADGQVLHVYRNTLESQGGWIGVHLREQGGGLSPVGAAVEVRTAQRTHVGRVVIGDTLMGQHASTLHFGLGAEERVESIEVRWVGGARRVLRDPEPGRYHLVLAPAP